MTSNSNAVKVTGKRIISLLGLLVIYCHSASTFCTGKNVVQHAQTSYGVSFRAAPTTLWLKKRNEEKNKDDSFDPILILPVSTIISCIFLFVGLLFYKSTNPTVEFDVDFYMALNGALRSSTSESIVGLPPLSPAEQLVGALFGPDLSPSQH